MNIEFLGPARREFLNSVEFYENRKQGLGEALISEVESSLDLLRKRPNIGSPYTKETRKLNLDTFPFTVVYLLEEDTVTIVALAHHRRRPGYWKSRC